MGAPDFGLLPLRGRDRTLAWITRAHKMGKEGYFFRTKPDSIFRGKRARKAPGSGSEKELDYCCLIV